MKDIFIFLIKGNNIIEVKLVIRVRKIMEGGVVVDGFPSSGLVNAITSECIIRSTKTKMIAVLDSPDFPTLSIISDYLPRFPARVYANEELNSLFCNRTRNR